MTLSVNPYGEKSYWDEIYEKKPENFEWVENYDTLKDFITSHVNKSDKILIPGCGNSELGPEMIKDGYTTIDNTDFSQVVIDHMKKIHPDQNWFVDNCRKMNIPDNTYDVVLEKSVIDALVTRDDDEAAVFETLSEYTRVLKKGGHAYIISFGQAPDREDYFKAANATWKYEGYIKLPREVAPNNYRHIYTISKP
ncbi:hypothetical protein TVAG_081710 [Trichomonas vaginalis G3]|uniref:Methyltransferase type 11 domain-containing protein n=1 Tax=Trichomonas vaginalis (strain ATCC PRA-98 / G3) TaxID=412133 RepID=A2E6W3_TRIV3|nr:methyltransferase protein [Trichomonas vaginalis G3]EAY11599.1 hypothetical protein TVAG_081710 [Trichomonas vaginalis G3]KAI5516518.1 methyltransferase protein [Trichomonas vaginalis G3]|eukprot:XP_001323822.1 hypothetical protein [Trichomonas vaginalis G3]